MMKNADFDREEEKGVSITTGFILNLGIATVAISLILFTLQGFFTDVRDDSKETQLRVVGERVVWELEKADRMARLSEDEGQVYFESDRLDSSYTMNITDDIVRLRTGDASVEIEHSVEVGNSPVQITGGQEHIIEYDNGDIEEIL